MEYKENVLRFEDYCKLRESVDWFFFLKNKHKKHSIIVYTR